MGTFAAQFSLFNVTGSWDNFPTVKEKRTLFPAGGSFSGSLAWSSSGNQISLDGNPPISFEGLPSGFKILSSTVSVRKSGGGSIGFVSKSVGGDTATANISFAGQSELTSGVGGGSSVPINSPFYNNLRPVTVLDLLGFIQLVGTLNSVGSNTEVHVEKSLEVSGTYTIESFSWAASVVGSNIQITSDGLTPNLTTVQKILIDYNNGNVEEIEVNAADFTAQTAILILFSLPEFCTFSGDVLISAVIGGVTSVIGSLTV